MTALILLNRLFNDTGRYADLIIRDFQYIAKSPYLYGGQVNFLSSSSPFSKSPYFSRILRSSSSIV